MLNIFLAAVAIDCFALLSTEVGFWFFSSHSPNPYISLVVIAPYAVDIIVRLITRRLDRSPTAASQIPVKIENTKPLGTRLRSIDFHVNMGKRLCIFSEVIYMTLAIKILLFFIFLSNYIDNYLRLFILQMVLPIISYVFMVFWRRWICKRKDDIFSVLKDLQVVDRVAQRANKTVIKLLIFTLVILQGLEFSIMSTSLDSNFSLIRHFG
ncbi:hypothetical protein CHUAL_001285 [Chamberlinius hualienensis]